MGIVPVKLSASEAGVDVWMASVSKGNYDAAVALSVDDQSALGKLILKVDEKKLYNEPVWKALLHYRPTFSGVKSQVDSPWFFHSTKGKTDSQAEMHATLAALFNTKIIPPLRLTSYCRFSARRTWLASLIPELTDLVPAQACDQLEQYLRFLNADSLTLVFPTSHPNSPASAFGHTLLRVDQEGQSQEAKLLNLSFNFAAEIPEQVSAFKYTFGGLAGAFPGKFTLLPYHAKLREYQLIDNRDTWEFPLKLSQEQLDFILLHAYEMLIAEFDYYFFSENCSYHLLGLLDVVFADDPLVNAFGLWTIPVDTIKVLDERGLIADNNFIPSTVRSLRQRESTLSADEHNIALKALSDGLESVAADIDQLQPARAAIVLDTIGDYNRFKRLKENSAASGLNNIERAVLSRRSKLGVKSIEPKVLPPTAAPQLGHDTARISVGVHNPANLNSQLELTYRPAYHDARDPSTGYGNRAAIEFFTTTLGYDLETESAFLRRFTLLSIESIEPRRGFFKPYSWRTNVEWEREDADRSHRFSFDSGIGAAYAINNSNTAVAFAFGEGEIIDDPSLPNRTGVRLGSRLGVHWEPKRRTRFGIEWEHREFIGDRAYESEALVWASLSPSRNNTLVLELGVENESNQSLDTSFSFQWRTYF